MSASFYALGTITTKFGIEEITYSRHQDWDRQDGWAYDVVLSWSPVVDLPEFWRQRIADLMWEHARHKDRSDGPWRFTNRGGVKAFGPVKGAAA